MTNYKTIEQWKEDLLGKQFNRLTVIEVIPNIRKSTGRKDGYKVVCKCDCGNIIEVPTSSIINGLTQSCGCLNTEKRKENIVKARKVLEDDTDNCIKIRKQAVENLKRWRENNQDLSLSIARRNIKFAQQWHRDHPEESKRISLLGIERSKQWTIENIDKARDILNRATQRSVEYRRNNPDVVNGIRNKIKLWRSTHKKEVCEGYRRSLISNISKEEKEVLGFLVSLGYLVEQQVMVGNHFYDFRINEFLIEYHGSIYHYTKYENLDNYNAKPPRSFIRSSEFHRDLRTIANNNGYHLIQVWDYDWFNNRSFVQKLIKDQLNGTADYRNYITEEGLLDNDYGFNVEGDSIDPTSKWISTWYRYIVQNTYQKGKVLVYNSGYTKVC